MQSTISPQGDFGVPEALFSSFGGSRLLAGVQITKEMPRAHRAHRRTSAYVEPVVGAFMKLFLALWFHCWELDLISNINSRKFLKPLYCLAFSTLILVLSSYKFLYDLYKNV